MLEIFFFDCSFVYFTPRVVNKFNFKNFRLIFNRVVVVCRFLVFEEIFKNCLNKAFFQFQYLIYFYFFLVKIRFFEIFKILKTVLNYFFLVNNHFPFWHLASGQNFASMRNPLQKLASQMRKNKK